MNNTQLERMHSGKGFIAALDQSGGSSPDALERYGVHRDQYSNEDEMFDRIHEMRTRVITSPSFSSDHILGAILFEGTMERQINGKPTAAFLWENKGVVPFLKIDQGMEAEQNGVRLMKPIPKLDELLKRALTYGIFGTKMRSFITDANQDGIREIVRQQFDYALQIADAGLVPIIEPEVDIRSKNKKESEEILLKALEDALQPLDSSIKLIFKLSLPSVPGYYAPLMKDPRVVRVVALSGGYSRDEADKLLFLNHGMIASFSRALLDGLTAQMSDEEFNKILGQTIQSIYNASIT
ncbi:fructose bisphosphate aldolase [Brucepastera parasyntrophica]|uniref:fructose bisphosphate aldolase n=1 Tax=Brucepastera parasyntrophica TaxID=2880008 RepID=UPI00210872F8|nr:fructose bisphosphate aldolase [Brucepastera parasyntrophica]ULQ60457.1 fructose bisphosphate aldolase [Brucepastera parasyntrophica]